MNVRKPMLRGAKMKQLVGTISLIVMSLQWNCGVSPGVTMGSAAPKSSITELNSKGPKAIPSPEVYSNRSSQPKLYKHWEYVVTIDSDLRWLDVQICFDEFLPKYLRADHRAAIDALESVRWSETGVELPIDHEKRRILLSKRSHDGVVDPPINPSEAKPVCIEYRASVEKILAEREGMGAFRRDHLVELAAGLWIWRPPKMSIDARFHVGFEVPPDMQVAVSWKPDPIRSKKSGRDSYWVDTTALRWLGWIVIGKLERQQFGFKDTNYQIVTLDELDHLQSSDLQDWIQESADGVHQLLGFSPNSRATVFVAPNQWGVSPVSFGMVARGGGPAVLLLINRRAKLPEIRGNWNVVHEFLHIGMPFIQDPWMGEGFVSYYTEVMMTRLGFRSETAGWKALIAAFDRGRKQSQRKQQTIQSSSNNMRAEHAYYHVYWGGAAIAFMLDIELRKATDGRLTLDNAIRELHRCCANTEKKYRAKQLMLHLDKWYGKAIFSRLSEEVLEGNPFPDLRSVFTEVGIEWNEDKTLFNRDEVGARMRRSIMGPQQNSQ